MHWYEGFPELEEEGIDEAERTKRLILLNQIRDGQFSGRFYWLVREAMYMKAAFENRLTSEDLHKDFQEIYLDHRHHTWKGPH